jgi:hypothetical protein
MGVKVQTQASPASPSMTSEVDGGVARDGGAVRHEMVAWERTTADRDREKGAEDRQKLTKHVREGREEGRAKDDGPKLHLECSRADGKAHQPTALFGGRTNIFCAVHG